MRLLNTKTGLFRWVDGLTEVRYAVLSHVWSRDGEQSYQDLLHMQHEASSKDNSNEEGSVLRTASQKIRDACAHALADGVEYIWMDFCCIDKTSSAEVSDAVLSMYAWYAHAVVCYVYLDDVEAEEDPRLPSAKFSWSRWHTRGWTLPELIAPNAVTFLSVDWRPIGTKQELADVLEAVTGVDKGVLTNDVPLSSISVARRMSWAAKRCTTRKEDEAYALLGLFGVHMPVMYGEGAHAFLRLQEEILKATGDQSLFVWDVNTSDSALDAELCDETRHTLFASSPAAFVCAAGVQVAPWKSLAGPKQSAGLDDEFPSYGIRSSWPVLPVGPVVRLALLPCVGEDGRRLALVLKKGENAPVHTVGTMGWEEARARYRVSLRTLPWKTDPALPEDTSAAASTETFTRVVRLERPWPKTIPASSICVARSPLNAFSVLLPTAHPDMSVNPSARERHDDFIRVDRTDSSLRGILWTCLADALDATTTLLGVTVIMAAAILLLMSILLLVYWLAGRYPLLP